VTIRYITNAALIPLSYRQAQNVNQSESFVTKCVPPGSEEVLLIIIYSILKLSTGFAVAACIVWKLKVISATQTIPPKLRAKTHQSIVVR